MNREELQNMLANIDICRIKSFTIIYEGYDAGKNSEKTITFQGY